MKGLPFYLALLLVGATASIQAAVVEQPVGNCSRCLCLCQEVFLQTLYLFKIKQPLATFLFYGFVAVLSSCLWQLSKNEKVQDGYMDNLGKTKAIISFCGVFFSL